MTVPIFPDGGQMIGGSSPARFVLDVPSDVEMIAPVVDELMGRCRRFRFEGSRLTLNLRVALSEALANAVLYGNGGDPAKRVRVEVSLDDSRVALSIEDEGQGFDRTRLPDPYEPPDVEESRGRGLFLMYKLMDEVEYNEPGNRVRLVLYREPPAGTGAPQ